MNSQIKPSKWYYLIPITLFIILIVLLINIVPNQIKSLTSTMKEFHVGDDYTLEVTKGEKYYLYADNVERDNIEFLIENNYSHINFKNISSQDISFNISIYNKNNPNDILTFTKLSNNTTISINEFEAFAYVQFDTEGTYVVTTTKTSPSPTINLGISNLNIFAMVGIIIGLVFGFFIFVVAIILSIILISNKRRKNYIQLNQ